MVLGRALCLGGASVGYRPSDRGTITQRCYPWGTICPGPNNARPTDYTFTLRLRSG